MTEELTPQFHWATVIVQLDLLQGTFQVPLNPDIVVHGANVTTPDECIHKLFSALAEQHLPLNSDKSVFPALSFKYVGFFSMLTIYVHYIRYSFDDQQALASLWTCKCGHICLYRHEFTLRTAHLKVSLPAQVPATNYLHKHHHTWGPSSRYNKMEHDVIQLLHSVQNPWHWVSLWQLCYIVFAEFWCLLQRA